MRESTLQVLLSPASLCGVGLFISQLQGPTKAYKTFKYGSGTRRPLRYKEMVNKQPVRYQISDTTLYLVPTRWGFEIHKLDGKQYEFIWHFDSLKQGVLFLDKFMTEEFSSRYKHLKKADFSHLEQEYRRALSALQQFYERMREPIENFQKTLNT